MKSNALVFILCLATSAAALFWFYPWPDYAADNFPWQRTLGSYVVLSVIMAGLLGPLSLALAGRRHTRVKTWIGSVGLFAAINAFLMLGPVAFFGGPGLFLDIPGTRVQGIFFAEWKFATFYFCVGLPSALMAAVIQTTVRRSVNAPVA